MPEPTQTYTLGVGVDAIVAAVEADEPLPKPNAKLPFPPRPSIYQPEPEWGETT